jgi:Fe-Mn family superoxide dismutase
MFLKIPLLPLLLLISPSSSSPSNTKPDLASESNQAYNIQPDNIHSYSAMSVGTYSLPALPYAYDVSSYPLTI